jgi:hypothetical protein
MLKNLRVRSIPEVWEKVGRGLLLGVGGGRGEEGGGNNKAAQVRAYATAHVSGACRGTGGERKNGKGA